MRSWKNASQRSHKICTGQTYIKFIKKTSMETVLHPREASAGDVNHLSEKDYQIKNILYIPWIFHYPTVKLLQDYRLKTLYKLSSPNLAHKTDWIHQYPAHKTEMSSHSWCLVAFVKQFTLKHEWKLYTFATTT